MSDQLNRERVAEIREHLRIADRDHADGEDVGVVLSYLTRDYEREDVQVMTAADLMALLDAHEAQRPRPASETPSDYDRCLFLVRGEKVLRCGEYQMGQWWTDHDDGDIPFLTPGIECWWPLPKGGADE